MATWKDFSKSAQSFGYWLPAHDAEAAKEHMDSSKDTYREFIGEASRGFPSVDEYVGKTVNGALGGMAGGVTGAVGGAYYLPKGSSWADYARNIFGSGFEGAVEGAKTMWNERSDQAPLRIAETVNGALAAPVNIADKALAYLGSDGTAAKKVLEGVRLNEDANTVNRLQRGDVQQSSRTPLGIAVRAAESLAGDKQNWANWARKSITQPAIELSDRTSKNLSEMASGGMAGDQRNEAVGNMNAAFNIGQATGTSMLGAATGGRIPAMAMYPFLQSTALRKSIDENNYLNNRNALVDDVSRYIESIYDRASGYYGKK